MNFRQVSLREIRVVLRCHNVCPRKTRKRIANGLITTKFGVIQIDDLLQVIKYTFVEFVGVQGVGNMRHIRKKPCLHVEAPRDAIRLGSWVAPIQERKSHFRKLWIISKRVLEP